eukprot:179283-Amphidinium_carterae.1
MLKINQTTTFDEVYQWISNYFNSTYAGADEENGTIGAINDPDEEQYEDWSEETEEYYDDYNDEDVKYVIAMLNKGKGKSRQKGGKSKGKDQGGKDKQGVTCYTRGKPGETVNGYSGYSGQPPYTGQPPATGLYPKGKGYGRQPWYNSGKGKKGQLPIGNIADYQQEDHNAYGETPNWNGYTGNLHPRLGTMDAKRGVPTMSGRTNSASYATTVLQWTAGLQPI